MSYEGDAAHARGLEHFDRREFDKAAEAFKQALELGVSFGPEVTHTSLGAAYLNLTLYEKAEQAHKRALEYNPDYAPAWKNLGILYRQWGSNYEEAIRCYRKALELEPRESDSINGLAVIQLLQDKPEQAITLLEQAIAIDDTTAVYHSNLAFALAMAGRFDEADRLLKRSIALGYHDWQTIKERIDNLRTFATPQRDTSWLPAVCPRCGASASAEKVTWTGAKSADCGSCGANLPTR